MEPEQGAQSMQGAQGVPGGQVVGTMPAGQADSSVSSGQITEPVPSGQIVNPMPNELLQVNPSNEPSRDVSQTTLGDELDSDVLDSIVTQVNSDYDVPRDDSEDDVVQEAPKKRMNKVLIGIIVLAVVAVFGIGFGVWAMVNSSTEKEQYEAKVSELKKQNSELQKQLDKKESETVDNVIKEEAEPEPEPEPVKDENMANYIYVGEWGLKIKKPDNLKKVSYAINAYADGDEKSLCVSGVVEKDDLLKYASLYDNFPGLGCISRKPKGSEGYYGFVVFSDDAFDFVYNGSQAIYSTNDDEKTIEDDSIQLVQQMLSNKDNYSNI